MVGATPVSALSNVAPVLRGIDGGTPPILPGAHQRNEETTMAVNTRVDQDGGGDLNRQLLTLSFSLKEPDDLDPLLERVGDARYVLLGEASHGTHEYYLWRARISRRLIDEKGFRFIAVEGDWPDCFRVNRYIQGEFENTHAEDVLRGFARWPTWMWANWEIVALTEWMRLHNDGRPEDEKVGFYGLDVYSLWESLYAIIGYLKQHDPEAVDAAYQAFRCFEPYAEDPQEYAVATLFVPDVCRNDVLELLRVVRERVAEHASGDQTSLDVIMNAEAVKDAEAYYRTMVRGGAESWNLRDRHMADTLDRLMQHYGPDAKAIVWEHNTHVGDARYTTMANEGMFNVGQLVRQEHGDDGVVLARFRLRTGHGRGGTELGCANGGDDGATGLARQLGARLAQHGGGEPAAAVPTAG